MVEITIDENACCGCELCVDVCPTDVLEYDKGTQKAKVKTPEDCIGCLSCTYVCPAGAIRQENLHVVKNFYRDLDFSNRTERFL